MNHNKHWEAREQQLIDMIAVLREQNQHLTQQLETANRERCEDQSELARHHDHFEQVSDLAHYLNLRLISLTCSGKPIYWRDIDRARDDYLTPIRNIVG